MMATNSSIEWTDTTWNPLAGCTRASEGCDNCYAAVMSLRLEAMAKKDIADGRDPGRKAKYIGVATKNNKGVAAFNGRINLDPAALEEPLRWKKPRTVFVNSMSDLFHKDVPTKFIVKVFRVMRDTPQHTYQVLTKRPERVAGLWPSLIYQIGGEWPKNVWIGTSVENQEQADKRIPHLLRIPAAVRFLSMEPLLGPVDLHGGEWGAICGQFCHRCGEFSWYEEDGNACPKCGKPAWTTHAKIHWVIVGGESGASARAFDLSWAYSIVNQCQGANVPVFVKQFGTNPTSVPCGYEIKDKKGGNWHEWPEDLRLREFPNA